MDQRMDSLQASVKAILRAEEGRGQLVADALADALVPVVSQQDQFTSQCNRLQASTEGIRKAQEMDRENLHLLSVEKEIHQKQLVHCEEQLVGYVKRLELCDTKLEELYTVQEANSTNLCTLNATVEVHEVQIGLFENQFFQQHDNSSELLHQVLIYFS